MRHHIGYILGFVLLVTAVFSSCELETAGEGGMQGFWHLVRVDTLETGSSKDLSSQLLFWAFEVHLLETSDHQGNHQNILFRFEKEGNQLRVYEPHVNNLGGADPATEDVSLLMPYGIHALEEYFVIEKESGGRMILSNNILRLYFRRM